MVWSRRSVLAQAACGLPWLPHGAVAAVVKPAARRRVALVIGNDRYRRNPLRNAANDARGVAALLGQAGFDVDLKLDATRAQMTDAIDALGRAIVQGDVQTIAFFYAGHAAQLDWRNYLLPVDGDVQSSADVVRQCVDLGLLIGRLSKTKGKTALIIIDACRDDPFGDRFRTPVKGMTPYDAPPGTLLAFATAPGRVALELPGRTNGLYTDHLLRELAVKGVRVEDALKRVRLGVRLASGGTQVPWESTSLESDFYLFATPKRSAAELEREYREEYEAWRRIKDSTRLEDWAEYLRRYPNGKFSELAQARVRQLLPEPAPTATPAGALRLGPGLPVPSRMKGSGNPHSAGSYAFRPVWTPGDSYEYVEMDLYSKVVTRRTTLVVKRVQGDRVELAEGSVLDGMGNVLLDGPQRRFEPPLQVNPDLLQLGQRWSSRYRQTGNPTGWGDYEFRIKARETVKVPAGEFAAFRVEGIGSFNGGAARMTRWMLPGLNMPVRRELERIGSARVLVSARQAVSG